MARLVAVVLALAFASASVAQNTVVLGPNYEKGQVSSRKLVFETPDGWVLDAEGAKQTGLQSILVPSGKTINTTDCAITVAFQKKDPKDAALADLNGFFRADLQVTLEQFPDLQAERWQPASFNPDRINFVSIELFGKAKNSKLSPHRLLIVDVGDGYYSITATAASRERLNGSDLRSFFDSISFQ